MGYIKCGNPCSQGIQECVLRLLLQLCMRHGWGYRPGRATVRARKAADKIEVLEMKRVNLWRQLM